MTICLQLLRSAANVFNSLRVMLAFPVNRLASATTTVCNVFLCPPCERLPCCAQEPMIEDNGVAARLAFWLRAQTITDVGHGEAGWPVFCQINVPCECRLC